jgi:hypothetical protein
VEARHHQRHPHAHWWCVSFPGAPVVVDGVLLFKFKAVVAGIACDAVGIPIPIPIPFELLFPAPPILTIPAVVEAEIEGGAANVAAGSL